MASKKTAKRRKGGKPRIASAALDRAVAQVLAGEAGAAEAAEAEGIPTQWRTVLRRAQEKQAAAPTATASRSSVAKAVVRGPSLPQGGAADRPDLLELIRRILDARNPGARRELDEGLLVHLRGGEEALAPWLARPLPSSPDVDPLDAAVAALSAAVSHAKALPPLHPRAATVLGAVRGLARDVESITRARPKVETEDELQVRLAALDAETLAAIEDTCIAAEARAARPRAGAPHGVCVTCAAPLVAPLGPLPC